MGMGRDGTPGSAGLHLAAGVPLLHPDERDRRRNIAAC